MIVHKIMHMHHFGGALGRVQFGSVHFPRIHDLGLLREVLSDENEEQKKVLKEGTQKPCIALKEETQESCFDYVQRRLKNCDWTKYYKKFYKKHT